MIGMILAYMITSGVIVAVVLIFNKYMNLQENIDMVIGILAIISVILYIISWLVCPSRICKRYVTDRIEYARWRIIIYPPLPLA